MYGFFNKLLRVDLGRQQYNIEEISDDILNRYLGGKGLGTHLLLNEVPANIDPLSEFNKLIFTCGPLTGSRMIGVSRYGVYTKSPLTGIYAESYAGGKVAPKMKATGFDAFIFEGVSPHPVLVEIDGGEVKFHEASDLWGKETYWTEDSVLAKVAKKDAQAIVIGPAGENLVRFACIKNNYWRSAGRCGVGAVMGAKKLKAIAFSGEEKCGLADEAMLDKYVKDFVSRSRTDPGVKIYQKYGTPIQVEVLNSIGGFPTRYYSRGYHPGWKNLSAEYMQTKLKARPRACHRCLFACGKYIEIKEGKYAGLKMEGPEYETIGAFGGLCELYSLEEVAYLNDICDRLGMDTITAGHMAAFSIEAARRGKIDIKISYGQTEQIAEFLRGVSQRRGPYAIFAQGIKTASRELGLEDIAIHVKGLEPALMDPRVLKGMGLAYATSCRGACHLRATFYKPELSGVIAPDRIEGKAKLFVEYEDRCTIFDTLILCRFLRDMVLWDDLHVLVRATTGLDLNKEALRRLAGRITTNTRRFNLREGMKPEDDTLPPRFMNEPLGEERKIIRQEDLTAMVQDYYQLRGWGSSGLVDTYGDSAPGLER